MCPRPEWAKDDPERWEEHKRQRKLRFCAMGWYVRQQMDKGRTQIEALRMLNHVMDNGYLPWKDPEWTSLMESSAT